MAISARDWTFIDDILTSLANKAKDGVAKIPMPGDPTLAPFSPDAAKAYLGDVAQRFNQLEKQAIELVASSAEGTPAYDMGKEIGRTLITGAKRASKIAKELGSDLADTFDKTADRLEEGGLTIAKSFGFGAVLVVVGLLIWLGRKA